MRAVGALLRKELLQHRAYPLDMVSLALSPFLIIAPFVLVAGVYGDRHLLASVAVGLVLWYWLSMYLWGVGFGVRDEIQQGVLEALAATPARLWAMLAAKALDGALVNLYVTIATLALLRIVAGVAPSGSAAGFALVFGAAGLALSGFSALYAALVLVTRQAATLGSISQQVMGIASGMTAPTSVLPRAVRYLSALLPLTYAIRGARLALRGVVPWADVSLLAGLGAGLWLLSGALLARAERAVRRTGSWGEY
ncbi:MAG: ABC transporter permease [Acidobacteria bacterium]|nr:ABC transporter permease [Acidobacteriota bacterium]